jgi:hypothetical protein
MKRTIIALLIYVSGIFPTYFLAKQTSIEMNEMLNKQYPSLPPVHYTVGDKTFSIICSAFSWLGFIGTGAYFIKQRISNNVDFDKVAR